MNDVHPSVPEYKHQAVGSGMPPGLADASVARASVHPGEVAMSAEARKRAEELRDEFVSEVNSRLRAYLDDARTAYGLSFWHMLNRDEIIVDFGEWLSLAGTEDDIGLGDIPPGVNE